MPMVDKIKGLSSLEARRRLQKYGANIIYQKKRSRPIIAFLEKFRSPLHPLILISIAGLVLIYLVLVEIGKRIFYRYNKGQINA